MDLNFSHLAQKYVPSICSTGPAISIGEQRQLGRSISIDSSLDCHLLDEEPLQIFQNKVKQSYDF